MPLKPYKLKAAQAMVRQAVQDSKRRWQLWQALEHLYRRGEAITSLDEVPKTLAEEFPNLTLDVINLVLPNAQILIAQAMAHDPAFLVEPYVGGDAAEHEAKMAEHLLRYFWKRTQATDVHRSMVQDSVVLGSGFCKVGWSFVEDAVERSDDELVEELLSLEEVELRDAELSDRQARPIDELSELLEVEEPDILMDEPFVEYVSPYDILVDQWARRLEDARWIAQRVVLPWDEVVSNKMFDAEALKHLKPHNASDEDPDTRPNEDESSQGESSDLAEGEDPFREVVLYEFYDMRSRRLLVFQLDAERALFNAELPYSHRHPPFVHMRNMEDGGRRFWPFGDLENIAAIQEELNQYVYEQMASARRSGTKYLIDKDVYDDSVKQALEAEQGDIVVPIEMGSKTFEESFHSVDRKALSPETFKAKDDLILYMREVLGINDFQAGGVGADRMSATAAAVVDGNSTLRGADKRFQVEDAAAKTGLRILLLCQEFLDEGFALRIVGSDGVVEWLEVSRDELRGEFGVSVTSGSTMAVNPATRMARALDVMTQIIPTLAQEGYDTHPLWRQALRDYGMDPDRMLRRLSQEELLSRYGQPPGMGTGSDPTVTQEALGGPPVPAAVGGDIAL